MYERLIPQVIIGDILSIRFKSKEKEGLFKAYTIEKIVDADFKKQFSNKIEGKVRINEGKSFGFIEDVFIHPSIVKAKKMVNGINISGEAIKTFKKDKNIWGWKLI